MEVALCCKVCVGNSFCLAFLCTLSFSVSSKSFYCHSYENNRGVYRLFPYWNSMLILWPEPIALCFHTLTNCPICKCFRLISLQMPGGYRGWETATSQVSLELRGWPAAAQTQEPLGSGFCVKWKFKSGPLPLSLLVSGPADHQTRKRKFLASAPVPASHRAQRRFGWSQQGWLSHGRPNCPRCGNTAPSPESIGPARLPRRAPHPDRRIH